jgi:hypothetical protein
MVAQAAAAIWSLVWGTAAATAGAVFSFLTAAGLAIAASVRAICCISFCGRTVIRSSVIDYAVNDRDLRVKTEVSDLKLEPLFWRRVLGKNYLFASYRIQVAALQLQWTTNRNRSLATAKKYKSGRSVRNVRIK